MRKQTLMLIVLSMVLWFGLPAAHANTYTVTNLNDSGTGSLRLAVLMANAAAGTDTITFSVSGTITLTSGQIAISDGVTLDGSGQTVTVSGNNASRIFQLNVGANAELRGLTLSNGIDAGQGGGAILNNGILTIKNGTFSGNTGREGGAIFSAGALFIDNSVFSANVTTNINTGGGAIYNNGGTLTVSSSTFTGNQSAADGGAIVTSGTTTITDATFAGNTAARSSGAIISITGTLTITGSTITGNTATTSQGGGIYSSGTLNITNSTVSGNEAATDGGGLYSATAVIDSSTITDNIATNGANLYIAANTTTISRSILNNGACVTAGGATLSDGANNLQFNAVGCVGEDGDPQLQGLANNGGMTQTYALGATSAALDKYTTGCPTFDQRGLPRPQNSMCDIGAFEVQTATTLVVSNLNDRGAGSLRAIIATAANNTTITFSVSGTLNLTSGQIDLNKDIIIDGIGQSIIIDANDMSRLFQVNTGTTLEIRNLWLTDGTTTAQGGAIHNSGTLILNQIRLDSSRSANGGAIYNSPGSNLTLNNSLISSNGTDSGSGGAIYNAGDSVIINRTTFFANAAGYSSSNGGAIYQTSGTLTVTESNFASNYGRFGGAIAYVAGIANIQNTTFYTNRGEVRGGDIYFINAGTMNLDSNTFYNSTAPTGATIDAAASGLTLSRSIVSSGSCTGSLGDGGNNIAFNAVGCPGTNVDPKLGWLQANDGTTQTMGLLPGSPARDAYTTGCLVADQRGITRPQGSACDIGAYEVYRGVHTVTNLNDSGVGSLRDMIATVIVDTIINFSVSGTITLTSGEIVINKNLTIDGSGQSVIISGGPSSRSLNINLGVYVELNNLTFINGGTGAGGAIFSGGALMVNNSAFSHNTANDSGGAIYHNNDYPLVINNSTFSDNSALVGGGAIYSRRSLTITNSTFSHNVLTGSGSGSGGAVYGGVTTIINSTFVNNASPSLVGGAIRATGTAIIDSSTFLNNTSLNGGNIYVESTAITISRSIFSGGTCALGTGTFTDGGNNIAFNAAGCPGTNVNPRLGTQGNYGGATQTIPLLIGSPAIDAYSMGCPATDQRGVARPQRGACDIGAFEVEPISESSISENAFYAALDTARTGYPEIQRVVVDFVAGAMNLTVVTATAGTGTVNVTLTQQDGFVTFNIASITVNGTPAPASYVTIINRDLPNLLVLALDSLVAERFGSGADVRTMTLTSSALVVEIGG